MVAAHEVWAETPSDFVSAASKVPINCLDFPGILCMLHPEC